jgi:hypothetical protein
MKRSKTDSVILSNRKRARIQSSHSTLFSSVIVSRRCMPLLQPNGFSLQYQSLIAKRYSTLMLFTQQQTLMLLVIKRRSKSWIIKDGESTRLPARWPRRGHQGRRAAAARRPASTLGQWGPYSAGAAMWGAQRRWILEEEEEMWTRLVLKGAGGTDVQRLGPWRWRRRWEREREGEEARSRTQAWGFCQLRAGIQGMANRVC